MLEVRLQSKADAPALLVCRRPDGSETRARLDPWFALHDLAHLAVESTLGIARGFFGLLCAGWSVESFTETGAAARLPAEAAWVELVVATLQAERAGSVGSSADELNEVLRATAEGQRMPECRVLDDAEWERVPAAEAELRRVWVGLAPGESLEHRFEPGVRTEPRPT